MASSQTEQRHRPVEQSVQMPVNAVSHLVSPPVATGIGPPSATSTPQQPPASDSESRLKSTQVEDDGTGSGSETAEPITPTSDANHHRFHDHGELPASDHHILPQYAPAMNLKPPTPIQTIPNTTSPILESPSRSPTRATNHSIAPGPDPLRPRPVFVPKTLPDTPPPPRKSPSQSSSEEPATPKGGIGKRVGSFVKSRLGRTSSSKNKNSLVPDGTDANSNNINRPNTGAVDSSTPTPKAKRISSFSLSVRNSPNTSKTNSGTNTPPSPASPIENNALEKSQTYNGIAGGHSQSTSGIARMSSPRPGVTWGSVPSGSGLQVPGPHRRRSASTDQIPIIRPTTDDQEGDPTDGLRISYSKMAVEGTGLKARRLSTSLPGEFWVDFCELEKEYKSPSIFPGRRGHLVGKGATATVTLMQRRGGHKDELYAVKEFRGKDKSEAEEEYIQKVKSEFSIAKSLHHPNIVDTVQLCVQHGRWNHVMEYCHVGELYTLVERGLFRTYYKLEDRLCFFKQIARGIDYLHSHGIAHRDIKLENLLMTNEGYIKITDFGVSEVFCGAHPGLRESGGQCGKDMGEIRRCAPGICGSLPYIAPEVLEKNGDYDPRPLDVWSCAIVFLTMTYSGSPWQAAKPEYQHYAKFAKGWSDWLAVHPDGMINDGVEGTPKCGPVFARLDSAPLKRLMLKMLHPDPKKRISMADALRTGLLKSVDCCSAESFEEPEQRGAVDATSKKSCKANRVLKKHSHLPPREHKTPRVLRHRFDMGDGYS